MGKNLRGGGASTILLERLRRAARTASKPAARRTIHRAAVPVEIGQQRKHDSEGMQADGVAADTRSQDIALECPRSTAGVRPSSQVHARDEETS